MAQALALARVWTVQNARSYAARALELFRVRGKLAERARP
jgi:hypothetical protein